MRIKILFFYILILLFYKCDPGVWKLKLIRVNAPDVSVKNLENNIEINNNDVFLRIEEAYLIGSPIHPTWAFFKIMITNNRLEYITIDSTKFELEIRGRKVSGLPSDQPVPAMVSEFKRLERTRLSSGQTVNGYVFFKELKFSFKDTPIILRINIIIDEARGEEVNFEIFLKRIY